MRNRVIFFEKSFQNWSTHFFTSLFHFRFFSDKFVILFWGIKMVSSQSSFFRFLTFPHEWWTAYTWRSQRVFFCWIFFAVRRIRYATASYGASGSQLWTIVLPRDGSAAGPPHRSGGSCGCCFCCCLDVDDRNVDVEVVYAAVVVDLKNCMDRIAEKTKKSSLAEGQRHKNRYLIGSIPNFFFLRFGTFMSNRSALAYHSSSSFG